MNFTTFIATLDGGLVRAVHVMDDQWAVVSQGAEHDIRCVAADPHDSNVLYAGTARDGILRSDNRGESWQSAGLAGQAVRAVAASPTEPGTVYAGTKPPALFVSRDGGKQWAELETLRAMRRWWWFSPAEWPVTPYVQAIALSPTDSDVLLVGMELGAVLRSTDGGATWSLHCKGALRDCHSLSFHPTDGAWVYQGGGGGAAVIQDAGRTFAQPQNPTTRTLRMLAGRYANTIFGVARTALDRYYGWAAAGDPAAPETWYCSVAPGPAQAHGHKGNANAYIYRHTAQQGWQRLAGGLPQPLNYMPYALITDADAPGHVYAGLSNGDIWFSSDHGDHWQQLPVNLIGIERTLVALK